MTCGMFRQLLADPRPWAETTVAERFAMLRHGRDCAECRELVEEYYEQHRQIDPEGAERQAREAANLRDEHDIPMGEN